MPDIVPCESPFALRSAGCYSIASIFLLILKSASPDALRGLWRVLIRFEGDDKLTVCGSLKAILARWLKTAR